ncbi:MAG TPA: pitrilysin family protein, partial [Gammaproteobacteria bacterium]
MPSRSLARLRVTALLLLGALLAPPLAAAPQIQTWTTPNGVRVLFIAADALPMVDVEVVFDAGSARDGALPGLALLTSGLLGEGAGGYDADAIAGTFEGLGARFGAQADRDLASVSLRSLTDPQLLEPALELLATILAEPTFAAPDFGRELDRMKVALQAQKQSPGDLAEQAFYAALYGDHPYAAPPAGSEASLAALTRDDVAAFHRRHYVARNALLAIVGAVDRAQAEALATRVTAGLAAGEPAPPLPAVPALDGPREVHVEFPSAQTHVLVGQPGIGRGDPDYFALYLGNHVLGGSGLVSRLNDTVREQRGLAYSVYSYFLPLRQPGPFQMGLQTRNDQAAEALALLDSELVRYVAEGPSGEELEF